MAGRLHTRGAWPTLTPAAWLTLGLLLYCSICMGLAVRSAARVEGVSGGRGGAVCV